MADYVKYRIAAAKLGVTMALAALIGGLATRGADAQRPQVKATGAASDAFLKLSGITGGTKNAFLKVESKLVKIDSSLSSLEHKLAKTYFTSQKIDTTFLKIKSANTDFLKIDDANADFLKIDAANSQFLKIDAANSQFLKIDDANSDFLKVGGTAANSSELGGLTPDAFVQGSANVSSGAVSIVLSGSPPATQTQLVQLPGGIIVVSVGGTVDQITVQVTNNTGVALPAVQDVDGTTTNQTLGIGATPLTIDTPADPHQMQLQIFPNAAFNHIVTLTLSTDGRAGTNTLPVVGQLLNAVNGDG